MAGSGANRALQIVVDEPRFPDTLPLARLPIVGRSELLGRLAKLMEQPGLITLTGPGGVGKTRLATEVARRSRLPVLFVPLAAVVDPDSVLGAVVAAARWTEAGDHDPLEVLLGGIEDDDALVVLDNMEHVVAAGPALERWTGECPGLRLLITSRLPLRVDGERTVAVETLDVPDAGSTARSIADAESVALFVEQARRADEDFALSSANSAAVGEICRRLDGLPLAIVLAASRLDVVSPVELNDLLGERLDALRSRQRSGDERHRSLRATIEWSYGLLDDQHRRLFRLCAAFVGGFGLDGLSAVSGHDRLAVVDILAELIDHSLVRVARSDGGVTRYEMLETIRDFARDELSNEAELDTVARAHVNWVRTLAASAEATLISDGRHGGPDGSAVLANELDNMRAAMQWSLDNGDASDAVVIAADLWRLWWLRGLLSEGRQWVTRALDAAGERLDLRTRADALAARGHMASEANDGDESDADLLRAAALYTELGSQVEIAKAWNGLAINARERSDLGAAEAWHRRVLEIADQLDGQRSLAAALNGLGAIGYLRNDLAAARDHWQAALEIVRQLGDRRSVGHMLSNLGVALLWLGDVSGATRAHLEASEIAREAGDLPGLMHGTCNLFEDYLKADDLDAAENVLAEAEALARQVGDRYVSHSVAFGKGQIAHRRGRLGEACGHFATALDGFRDLDVDIDVAHALEHLGVIAADAGQPEASSFFGLAASMRSATESEAPGDEVAWIEAAGRRASEPGRQPYADAVAAIAAARQLSDRLAGMDVSPARAAGYSSAAWTATGLTRREAEVADMLRQRATDQEIAAALFISVRTASTHVGAVLRKLGVASRREVADALVAHGLGA